MLPLQTTKPAQPFNHHPNIRNAPHGPFTTPTGRSFLAAQSLISVTYSEDHAANACADGIGSFWTNWRNSTRVNFHSKGLATCS